MMRGTVGFEILDGCRRTIGENDAKNGGEKNCGFVGGGGDSWTETGTGTVTNHGVRRSLAGWRRHVGTWHEDGQGGGTGPGGCQGGGRRER